MVSGYFLGRKIILMDRGYVPSTSAAIFILLGTFLKRKTVLNDVLFVFHSH